MVKHQKVSKYYDQDCRWTVHRIACKTVYDGYQQLLVALSVGLNERQELEVMDLFAALAEEELLASLLFLMDIFDAIVPLKLALEKIHESLCLSDVKTYIGKTQDALKKLAIRGHWFDEEKIKSLKQIAADQTSSLPPSANLQKNVLFKWDEFKENVYLKFISSFQSEIESAFNQLQFGLNFTVLDPRKFPETISHVESYGIEEINELVNFYGVDKKDTYKGESAFQKADLDKIATLAEFEDFK